MAATAAPGNTVVFGDSLPANPTAGDWLTAKGAPIPGGRVNEMGCGTDFQFSGAVGAGNGTPIADYEAPREQTVVPGTRIMVALAELVAWMDAHGVKSVRELSGAVEV